MSGYEETDAEEYAGGTVGRHGESAVDGYAENTVSREENGVMSRGGGPAAGRRVCCMLVVLPIDAFTGKTILEKDFSVELEGASPPVRKQEGFFVFLSMPPVYGKKQSVQEQNTWTVRLRGRGYQETAIEVPAGSVTLKDPVLTVRMNPNTSYPFPMQTVRMSGLLSENCCLSAVLLQKGSGFRLSQDYHAGEEHISVYRGDRTNLAGVLLYMETVCTVRNMVIDHVSEKRSGRFLLLGKAEGGAAGRYRLSEPMAEHYDRRTTRLYPAQMHTTGDRAESYFFAFCPQETMQAVKTSGTEGNRAGGGSGAEEERAGRIPGTGGERTGSVQCKTERRAGCDILCRVETKAGTREYCFSVESGDTKIMDF